MTDADDPERHVREREDEWLVVRCQLGERPAFDELIRRWHGPIWQYARRLTGDDEAANDVVQDVWLRVLRGIGRLRDGSKLRAWLFGIARRTLMDRFRERYAAPDISDVELTDIPIAAAGSGSGADDAMIRSAAGAGLTDSFDAPAALEADLARMEGELRRLPVTEREVLTLFYLRELSLAEVADVLDVPVGTVKSRLFRARKMLRQQLDTLTIRMKGRQV